MRWFKHLTDANTGETLSLLMDEMGFEGIGMFWTVIEVVAFHWDGKGQPKLIRSPKAWRKLTGIFPQTFLKLLRFLGDFGDFSVTFGEKTIEVCIPKLLELKDEYSRKSGHKPDNVAPELDTDTEGESDNTPPSPPAGGDVSDEKEQPKVKRKKNTAPGYTQSFESWWELYPRKVGKDAAFKAWQKVAHRGDVKVPELILAIQAQIAAEHFRNERGEEFIPNPSTWLNQARWKDEIRRMREEVF